MVLRPRSQVQISLLALGVVSSLVGLPVAAGCGEARPPVSLQMSADPCLRQPETIDRGVCNEVASHGCELIARGMVESDPACAIQLFRASCEAGNGTSCVDAGRMYMDTRRIPNFRLAERYLSVACSSGIPEGCFYLAEAMLTSGGRIYHDVDVARGLYRRACSDGVVMACDRLGLPAEADSPAP